MLELMDASVLGPISVRHSQVSTPRRRRTEAATEFRKRVRKRENDFSRGFSLLRVKTFVFILFVLIQDYSPFFQSNWKNVRNSPPLGSSMESKIAPSTNSDQPSSPINQKLPLPPCQSIPSFFPANKSPSGPGGSASASIKTAR